jgi:anti-sigma factor RsiW
MGVLNRQISCQELVEFASGYLDGTLSARARHAVERHLATCPNCPNYVAQLRLTVRLTGRLRTDDVPAELLEVLTRAWEDQHPSTEPPRH